MEANQEARKTSQAPDITLSEVTSRMEELKLQLKDMEKDLLCLKDGYKTIEDRVNVLDESSSRPITGRRTRNAA